MNTRLRNTFINQLTTFSQQIEALMNGDNITKNALIETINYYQELQQFARQECGDDVIMMLDRLSPLEGSLKRNINDGNTSGGLFFSRRAHKINEEGSAYLRRMKELVDSVVFFMEFKN